MTSDRQLTPQIDHAEAVMAALDLGSNTFLCLVGSVSNGELKILHDEVRYVRLAEGLAKTGHISEEAFARAEKVLDDFAETLKNLKVERAFAAATSAARDARNGERLFKICKKHGIELVIFSGEEEALTTFLGAQFGATFAAPPIVVDIGGGSTEIVSQKNDVLVGKSFDVGCVRIFESLLVQAPLASPGQAVQLLQTIKGNFGDLAKIFNSFAQSEILAVAGTPVELVRMYNGLKYGNQEFSHEAVHNKVLTHPALQELVQILAVTSPGELTRVYGVTEKRADLLLAGALILLAVLELLGRDKFRVSTRGLRYGLLQKMAGQQ